MDFGREIDQRYFQFATRRCCIKGVQYEPISVTNHKIVFKTMSLLIVLVKLNRADICKSNITTDLYGPRTVTNYCYFFLMSFDSFNMIPREFGTN